MADDDGDNDSRRGPLIGLAVVVIIFVVGWLLARELYSSGRMGDCVMSGRTNCAPIEAPAR
jgi:hypothetical protein